MSKKQFIGITPRKSEVWEEILNEHMDSIKEDYYAYMCSLGIFIFGEDDLKYRDNFLDFVIYRYRDIEEAIRAMYYPLAYKDTIRDQIKNIIKCNIGV